MQHVDEQEKSPSYEHYQIQKIIIIFITPEEPYPLVFWQNNPGGSTSYSGTNIGSLTIWS